MALRTLEYTMKRYAQQANLYRYFGLNQSLDLKTTRTSQCRSSLEQNIYRYQHSSAASSCKDDAVSHRHRPLNPTLVHLLNHHSNSEDKHKYTDPTKIRIDELSQQTKNLIPHFTANSTSTGEQYDARPSNEDDNFRSSCIALMKDWFQLQSDILHSNTDATTILSSRKQQRIIRREIPPKSSPHYSLITCAENIHSLLLQYISLFKQMKTKDSFLQHETTLPFQLAMNAWNQTSSYTSKFCYPLSGDYCASILDEWGSLLEGDLIHSPTTKAFNLVLETYAFCSSGPYNFDSSTSPLSNMHTTISSISSPSLSLKAVEAWDIYQRLNQDFVLRPTIETFCHVITTLKNHSFALHFSKSQQNCTEFHRNKTIASSSTSTSFLNSYTAASLAFQTFLTLEETLSKKATKLDWKGNINSHSKQPLELLVLEAFTNIIALISRGFLSKKDFHCAYPKASLKTYGEQAEYIIDRSLDILPKIEDSNISLILSEYVSDSYLSCMIAWSKDQENGSDKVQAAESVMRLFHHLQALANQHRWDDTIPHSSHYYTVLNAYARSFENIPTLSESDTKVLLTLKPYRKCWNILEQMEERNYNNRLHVNDPLDIQLIYCKTISVLSQCIRHNLCPHDIMMVVNNAETALTTLIHKYQSGSLRIYDPQDITRAFNNVMLIHSHPSLHKLTGNKISNLFSELIQLSKGNNHNSPKPDSYTYSLYMNQLSHSTSNDSVNKLVKVLTDIEKQYESGYGHVSPNVAHYSIVLKLLGKVHGKHNSSTIMEIFNRAEEKLSRSINEQTDDRDNYLSPVVLYSSYVSGLSDSGYPTCGYEALKTLRLLKQRYQENGDIKFQPDIIMYSVVLDAISKSKVIDRQLLSEAQAILDEIETMFYDGKKMIPNRIIYTSAMKIWSKSSLDEAPDKCIELIEKMIKMYNETGYDDISPDIVSYSVALDSISRSPKPGSVDTALMLLNDMEDRSNKGAYYLKPNVIVYTKVINAIWKSGHDDAGGLAEIILNRMEERCREGGDFTANPDCYTYTSIINCWARSKRSDKVNKAWDTLWKMKENYEKGNIAAKPNVVAITSFLNCCAYAPNDDKAKNEATLFATRAFQLLKSNSQFGVANSTTYRTLLEVFGRNIKDVKTRNNHSSKIFQLCSDSGMVDDYVISNLKRYTIDLYKQLPSTLPKSWSRNTSR